MRWSKAAAVEALAVLVLSAVGGGVWIGIEQLAESDSQHERQFEFLLCPRDVPRWAKRGTIKKRNGIPVATFPVEHGGNRRPVILANECGPWATGLDIDRAKRR